jgi:hypothetical protein
MNADHALVADRASDGLLRDVLATDVQELIRVHRWWTLAFYWVLAAAGITVVWMTGGLKAVAF